MNDEKIFQINILEELIHMVNLSSDEIIENYYKGQSALESRTLLMIKLYTVTLYIMNNEAPSRSNIERILGITISREYRPSNYIRLIKNDGVDFTSLLKKPFLIRIFLNKYPFPFMFNLGDYIWSKQLLELMITKRFCCSICNDTFRKELVKHEIEIHNKSIRMGYLSIKDYIYESYKDYLIKVLYQEYNNNKNLYYAQIYKLNFFNTHKIFIKPVHETTGKYNYIHTIYGIKKSGTIVYTKNPYGISSCKEDDAFPFEKLFTSVHEKGLMLILDVSSDQGPWMLGDFNKLELIQNYYISCWDNHTNPYANIFYLPIKFQKEVYEKMKFNIDYKDIQADLSHQESKEAFYLKYITLVTYVENIFDEHLGRIGHKKLNFDLIKNDDNKSFILDYKLKE